MDCIQFVSLGCVDHHYCYTATAPTAVITDWDRHTDSSKKEPHLAVHTLPGRSDKKSLLTNQNQNTDQYNTLFLLTRKWKLEHKTRTHTTGLLYVSTGMLFALMQVKTGLSLQKTGLCLWFLTQNLSPGQSAESHRCPVNTYTRENTRCYIWQTPAAVYFFKS